MVEILGIKKDILEQKERERRQMFAEDEARLDEEPKMYNCDQ